MAHFARINESNIVTDVVVIDNNLESIGAEYCSALLGGTWIQTSYNTKANVHSLGQVPLRKNYAGIGYIYSYELDAFIEPCPWPSWQLNQELGQYECPVPVPETDPGQGMIWAWDEVQLSWVSVPL